VTPPPKNLAAQNHQIFGVIFDQLHYLIAHISGTQQDVVSRKTALQSTISPVYMHFFW